VRSNKRLLSMASPQDTIRRLRDEKESLSRYVVSLLNNQSHFQSEPLPYYGYAPVGPSSHIPPSAHTNTTPVRFTTKPVSADSVMREVRALAHPQKQTQALRSSLASSTATAAVATRESGRPYTPPRDRYLFGDPHGHAIRHRSRSETAGHRDDSNDIAHQHVPQRSARAMTPRDPHTLSEAGYASQMQRPLHPLDDVVSSLQEDVDARLQGSLRNDDNRLKHICSVSVCVCAWQCVLAQRECVCRCY
jgi:hypothetical protein